MKSKWNTDVKASKVGTGKSMKVVGKIPNDFRAHVIKNFEPDAKIMDKNNIDYGNIRPNYVSLRVGMWDELLKEEVELTEEFSEKDFDALKKGDIITIEFKSSMSSGTSKFKVTAKNIVGKAKVGKVTLQNTKNPKGIKHYLYKRGNKVSFAQGDMGASVVKYAIEELEDEGSKKRLKATDEEAPANNTLGVDMTPHLKRKRGRKKVETEEFGGNRVFVVSSQRWHDSRLGKARYSRYDKYVGNDSIGNAIREYGRGNPKAPIILKNSQTGAMLYLKYGSKRK